MFITTVTREYFDPTIKVHLEEKDFEGINDLSDWPVVLEFGMPKETNNRTCVYMREDEARRLNLQLNQMLGELDRRKIEKELGR